MKELTTRQYWESVYTHGRAAPSLRRSLKRALETTLGERGADYFRRYPDYLLWNVILARHLPPQPGLKAVEIGCAPGWFLVKLRERFGYDVYGIEYAERGVAENRRLFALQGLNPEHVWHADFFAKELHQAHAGEFDLVISRGFIEHFSDPRAVVERHVNLLTPGGTLVVSVPNKRGLNKAFTALFHHQALALHNLEIMQRRVFASLFDDPRLEPRYCDYFGLFSFDQFNTPPGSAMKPVLAAGKAIQYPLNALFRLLFPRGGVESAWTSPHLIYIGTKTKN